MKWLALLQTAVAQQAKSLPKELIDLLMKIPYMTAIPMTQLEELGAATWGPSDTLEYVGTQVPPLEVRAMELLEQIHESYPSVEACPDTITMIKRNGTLIKNPKWWLAYLAILAWCEIHAPRYSDPELSDEDRLDQLIERLPFEFNFELADVIELAIKCGWDLTVDDNYNTEPLSIHGVQPEQQSEISCWLPAVKYCVVFRCNSGPACLHIPEAEGYLHFGSGISHRWKPRDDRWLRVIDALQERLTMSRKTRTLFGHPIGSTFIGYYKRYE